MLIRCVPDRDPAHFASCVEALSVFADGARADETRPGWIWLSPRIGRVHRTPQHWARTVEAYLRARGLLCRVDLSSYVMRKTGRRRQSGSRAA